MRRPGDDIRTARGLASADYAERREAVGCFVRSCTLSAPTELALLAVEHPEACRSYRGERPLVEHLLTTLPLPEELALAWRIALLDGDALREAVRELDARIGPSVRAGLAKHGGDPEDAWQSFLLLIMSNARLRQTCFGKFSGKGSLAGYLRTAVGRESARAQKGARPRSGATGSDASRRAGGEDDFLDELPGRDDTPSRSAVRRELRAHVAEVLGDVADDPGLTFFLVQEGLGLTPVEIARAFALKENAVRQRTFRFRERFRHAWRRRHPDRQSPFCATDEP